MSRISLTRVCFMYTDPANRRLITARGLFDPAGLYHHHIIIVYIQQYYIPESVLCLYTKYNIELCCLCNSRQTNCIMFFNLSRVLLLYNFCFFILFYLLALATMRNLFHK